MNDNPVEPEINNTSEQEDKRKNGPQPGAAQPDVSADDKDKGKQVSQSGGPSVADSQIGYAGRDVIQNNYMQTLNFAKRTEIRTFSIIDADFLPEEDIRNSADLFVYPEEEKQKLLNCLKKNRLILLTSRGGGGKFFTAKFLASSVKAPNIHHVKSIELPAEEVKVELTNLIKYSNELKKNILVFRNIFYRKDQKIVNFFRLFNFAQMSDISERLIKLDAYIIFTADTDTFEEEYLTRCTAIRHNIVPISHQLLENGFKSLLAHLCNSTSGRDYQQAAQLLMNHQEEIVKEAKTMPRIALFLKIELDQILAGYPVETSIKEFFGDPRANLKKWFMKDIALNKSDFEASTFALCLTLFNGVTYADFVTLHRGITVLLLKKIFPYRPLKDFSFSFSESELLDKCRADIIKSGTPNVFRIGFVDDNYHKVLRDMLWTNHRKLLVHLVSFLREFAETTPDRHLCKLAIRHLVRIGTLAPESVIISTAYKWVDIENGKQLLNIGYLYEAIFNCYDENVKNYCMKELKEIILKGSNLNQIIPVMAYRQIGFKHLEFAMREMREVLEVNSKWLLREYFMSKATIQDEKELHEILREIYLDKGKDDEVDILFLVSLSIVDLALQHTPGDVFDELTKWIVTPAGQSKEWAVLFVMGPYGILEELETAPKKFTIEDEAGRKRDVRTNHLLFSLSTDDRQCEKMAYFLLQLYSQCFCEYKTNVSRILKKKLFKHFEEWTVKNLSNIRGMAGLKKMLTFFFHGGDQVLKSELWDSITGWNIKDLSKRTKKDKEIEQEEAKLNDFINDIRKQFFTSKGVKKWKPADNIQNQ